MEKHPHTKANLVGWGWVAAMSWFVGLIQCHKNPEGGIATLCLAIACSACWGAWAHINHLERSQQP